MAEGTQIDDFAIGSIDTLIRIVGLRINDLRQYRDFNEARKFARQLNLTSHKEWTKYCKSGKPVDIPYNPDREYKHKAWISWGDWLGTENVASKNKKYLPFKESREVIRSLNLKNGKEFKAVPKIC